MAENVGNDEIHQPLRFGFGDGRQDDQARIKIDAGSKFLKIIGILGYDDAVLGHGTRENQGIRLLKTATIPRVRGIMFASTAQVICDGDMHSSTQNFTTSR